MKYNMNGEYPRMANWVLVRRLETGMFEVKNILTSTTYEFGEMIWRFLKDLDGNTDPYDAAIKWGVDLDELEEIMALLDEEFLVRDKSKTIWIEKGQCLRTVFIPKKKKTKSIIPALYNLFLLLGWCPMLIWGISTIILYEMELERAMDSCLETPSLIAGFVLGIGLGMLLHEISHAMSCLSYGGYFCEMGIFLKYFFPGAYVLIEIEHIKSTLKRIQINAAGAEMNLFLTGIFFLLTIYCEQLGGCFLWCAIYNLGLGVMNLTFLESLDGHTIWMEYLGLKEGVSEAGFLFREFVKKFDIKKLTIHQVAVFIVCVIVLIYQVLWFSIIINNILLLIGDFL